VRRRAVSDIVPLSVHDYFDILGVSGNAPAAEIRRACSRRTRSSHPDFRDGERDPVRPRTPDARARHCAHLQTDTLDAAIDFVTMTGIVDRMREQFFADGPRSGADLAGRPSEAR
jgi:hypothetical protein